MKRRGGCGLLILGALLLTFFIVALTFHRVAEMRDLGRETVDVLYVPV